MVDVGSREDLYDTWTGPDNRNEIITVFLQDRWSPSPSLTFLAGLRYDRQRGFYEPGKRAPVLSDIFPTRETEGVFVQAEAQLRAALRRELRLRRRQDRGQGVLGPLLQRADDGARQQQQSRRRELPDLQVQRRERQPALRRPARSSGRSCRPAAASRRSSTRTSSRPTPTRSAARSSTSSGASRRCAWPTCARWCATRSA